MGSAEWLRMYAQRLEDEHAPHNLSIGMREAADQMDQQRETVLQLLGQVGQLSEEIERLKDVEARLRAALEVTSSDCKEAFAENERLLAANRDVMLHWDVLKADYDNLRAALRGIANHNSSPTLDGAAHKIARKTVTIARAALEGE